MRNESTASGPATRDAQDEVLANVDLRQRGPRLRRTAVSLLWAALVGAAVAVLCWYAMDLGADRVVITPTASPWRAAGYFAGGAAVVAFTIAHRLQRRRFERETALAPRARLKS